MSSDGDGAPPAADADVPRAVALFGSFLLGQYYEDILTGVVAAAQQTHSSVISVQSSAGVLPSSLETGGQDAVSRAAWDHFDGAIVILQSVSLDYVARLRAAGKFVVAIGQELRGTQAAIALDNPGGVRQGISHLAEHGHRRIGFVAPTWQVDTPERYGAYRQQMLELGLEPLPLLGADLSPELSLDEQGYLAAQDFLAGDRRCTALMFVTDPIALGFIRGLQEAGVKIPGDVAVVGIDDIDEAAVSSPALATVAISFERVGETAFNVAYHGGRGEQMQDRYLVPQRFVARESCGCLSDSATHTGGSSSSPHEVFEQALAEAAQEGALVTSVDATAVRDLAHRVAAALQQPVGRYAGPDKEAIAQLAAEINERCALDRSVQAVLLAIRTLAQDLASTDDGPESPGSLTISPTALDLCDAVRSGQLQRRMSEYVDMKRLQVSHYFIGNSLLGHDRDELRSLSWLQQTPCQAGALGLWKPPDDTDNLVVAGIYERSLGTADGATLSGETVPVEAFPPRQMLADPSGRGRLVVITQVSLEDSDWGLLAVGGGHVLQSALIQETFQQWSILMSASLEAEKAIADLARQGEELNTAYAMELSLLEEVRISEERYALAAEAAHDALWDWDIATGKVFYSSNWKALLGFRESEIGTSPDEWLGRVHPDDAVLVQEQVTNALSGAEQFIDVEHRLEVSSGEYRWISCSGRSVIDPQTGRPSRLVGSINDVTVRKLLQEQLVQEAMFDALTGLAKANLFKDRLAKAFQRSREDPDYSFAVLFMDLDGFKAVNDNLGHAAGDELLASVAERLAKSLRKDDTAARLGGDEFAIILLAVDPKTELPMIIERIQAAIREPHQVGDLTANVGAAIGFAISGGDYASAEEMLSEADAGMYRAKKRNKQALGLPPDARI